MKYCGKNGEPKRLRNLSTKFILFYLHNPKNKEIMRTVPKRYVKFSKN